MKKSKQLRPVLENELKQVVGGACAAHAKIVFTSQGSNKNAPRTGRVETFDLVFESITQTH
jgi:hypothetical protein